MDSPQDIIRALAKRGRFPRAAVRAAQARREEMLPHFLGRIEAATRGPAEALDELDAILLIFYLLGEWREPRAYRLLARMLRTRPDEIDLLLGDGVTEGADRVMAAVCDGDLQPIIEVIEDRAADEFVRGAMFGALEQLWRTGPQLRAEIDGFMRRYPLEATPGEGDPAWLRWMDAVAALGLEDLVPQVRSAFDRGLVDAFHGDFDDFQDHLGLGVLRRAGEAPQPEPRAVDTAAELSRWAGFRERREAADSWRDARGPHVNHTRDVGRNDPCPCGSGRKFKKCCLQDAAPLG